MEIIDKIQELPWNADKKRRWKTRELSKIDKIIIHQEQGEGTVEQVNRFHIGANHISAFGCPHFCYHYGIEKDGTIIQANSLTDKTWHTGGQNETGVAIMVAGNFIGRGFKLGREKPEAIQMKSLSWLVRNHLLTLLKLGVDDVYGHYHFGKPYCPGEYIEAWIEMLRKENTPEYSIKELQLYLKKLGYEPGAIDGDWGIKTMAALRIFQKNNGLVADGVPGPKTFLVIKKLLTEKQ